MTHLQTHSLTAAQIRRELGHPDRRCRRPLHGALADGERRDRLPISRSRAARRCARGSLPAPRTCSTPPSFPPIARRPTSCGRGARCRRGGAIRSSDSYDRATAHVPRLMYERLDEFGIDYMLAYPSWSLGMLDGRDDELRAPVLRALNRYTSRLFTPYADRLSSAALIPMNTPEEAVGELRYAVAGAGLQVGRHRRPRDPQAHRRSARSGVPARHLRPRQCLRLRPVLGRVRRARHHAGDAQQPAVAPQHPLDHQLLLQPHRRARGQPLRAREIPRDGRGFQRVSPPCASASSRAGWRGR